MRVSVRGINGCSGEKEATAAAVLQEQYLLLR
jgi:hypothetical protein